MNRYDKCQCRVCKEQRASEALKEDTTDPGISHEDLLWNEEHQWGQDSIVESIQDAVATRGYVEISRVLEEATSGAFLEYVGTNAQRWAQEYCGIHGGDEGNMIGWFANAIETGRSAGHSGIQDTVPKAVWRNDVARLLAIARWAKDDGSWSHGQSRDYAQTVVELQKRLDQ